MGTGNSIKDFGTDHLCNFLLLLLMLSALVSCGRTLNVDKNLESTSAPRSLEEPSEIDENPIEDNEDNIDDSIDENIDDENDNIPDSTMDDETEIPTQGPPMPKDPDSPAELSGEKVCQKKSAPLPKGGRNIEVSSMAELNSALSGARNGDHIVLAAGTYGGFTLSKSGTKDNPIVIRAASKLAAKVSGAVSLSGSHLIVAGFDFYNDQTVSISGSYVRLTSSQFSPKLKFGVMVTAQARDVIIGHNEFASRVEGTSEVIHHIKTQYNDQKGYRHYIHHNYIHGIRGKRFNSAIVLGDNGYRRLLNTGNLVECNLIESSPGGRGVSIKSSGNIIRFNTHLKSSPESFVSRGGVENKFLGNWIEASGPIRVIDRDNQVIGNRGAIKLSSGTCTSEVYDRDRDASDCSKPAYSPATNTLAVGNIGTIFVGNAPNPSFSTPALNTLIEAHVGDIKKEIEEKTTVKKNTTRRVPVAFKLSPQLVGPRAPTAPEL